MWRSAGISHRVLSLCIALLFTTGCSGWRTAGGPVVQVIETQKEPSQVRLTFTDGRKLVMRDLRVGEDSVLVGVRAAGADSGFWFRDSVSISDVYRVETRQHSGGRTGLLVVGIVVGIPALIIAMLAISGNDMSMW